MLEVLVTKMSFKGRGGEARVPGARCVSCLKLLKQLALFNLLEDNFVWWSFTGLASNGLRNDGNLHSWPLKTS